MALFAMMVGIPGSGKSTAAERIARAEAAVLVSTDRLREELMGRAEDRSRDRLVFARALAVMREALLDGRNVVYDATNLTRDARRRVLKALPAGIRKVCHYLRTPLHAALVRNQARRRMVPPEVIARMCARLRAPEMSEGWDEIRVIEVTPTPPA